LLGQWRNYDTLEEDLTLQELMITYDKILETRFDRMEFEAKIAGAEIKSSRSSSGSSESEPAKESSLVSRLREKKEKELQSQARSDKPTSFSDGVGYRVI
jgi:hypothetical protein